MMRSYEGFLEVTRPAERPDPRAAEGQAGAHRPRAPPPVRIPHIATGDMFRAAIEAAPLGQEVEPILASGALVPDELTIRLIRERLSEEDAGRLLVLDGFPRNTAQAGALDERRYSAGRSTSCSIFRCRTRSACRKAARPGGGRGRTDDSPEVIAKRLEIFHQTEPLIGYYLPRGIVVGIHSRSRGEGLGGDRRSARARGGARAGDPA